MQATIKIGNDMRQKLGSGALQKWEDIISMKAGTVIQVVKECHDTRLAAVLLPMGATSPCGQKSYKAGTKRLIPLDAIEKMNLDALMEKAAPWMDRAAA